VPVWATTYSPDGVDYYTYANYSFASYLRFVFDGSTTSYDAMYGWGIVLVATWQAQVSAGQAPGAPEAICVPTKTVKAAGQAIIDFHNTTSG
jgi:hypothetical protein